MAAGVRITWSDLPHQVRLAVEDLLGDRVVETWPQTGGFSPGTADRVVTSSGRRAFVKAVSSAQNADTPGLHRREAAIAAYMPATPHTPRLLGSFDDGDWVALVMEDVEGRHPRTPWDRAELDEVLQSLKSLGATLTPTPVRNLPLAADDLADDFAGWQRIIADSPAVLDPWCATRLNALAESAAQGLEALTGESMLHTDLRADNLLIRPDGTVAFIDWPWACIGPSWLDVMFVLMNVNLFGGHNMETLAREHLPEVPERSVTGVLAGLAGYFIDIARQPPPPGLPTVRAFQERQGKAALQWLRERLR